MTRKAKGTVFKMKSGNSPLFKQMGSSPVKIVTSSAGKADAELVRQSHKTSMAKVPGDWTQHYNKQYEGIIAANYAKANIGKAIVDAGVNIAGAYFERKKEGDEKAEKAVKDALG